MFYLLLGQDHPAKESKLQEIKSSLLTTPDQQQFDYQVLYGHKLSAEDFKKALVALPAMAQKRLVVVFQLDKLSKQNQDILIDILKESPGHLALVLDSDAENAFAKKVAAHTQKIAFKTKQLNNVFDMTRPLGAGNTSDALKMLNQLYAQGEHPLKVMGGLVWFWGKQKSSLSPDRYKKGLLEIQEADMNIKRSRLKPEYALEKAIVKLSLLLQA